jgi:sugar phosphate isomerase/epimerase
MLDRRAFLLTSAAAALTGPTLARATAAPPLRFGFSTYGMKTMPVLDALDCLAQIGYRSVELALMEGWPSEPKLLSPTDRDAIRKFLTDQQIVLDALMLNIRPSTDPKAAANPIRQLREGAQLGRDLTKAKCPPIETVIGGRPDQWDELKDDLAKGLEPWAKAAEKDDFVVAIKPHVSGAMCTPERAVWLRDRIGFPHIQLAYDYSHFGLQDIPLEASMKAMLPHTVFVHIKDFIKREKGFEFVLPGEADFDYGRYARLLHQNGYTGPVCVEVSGQVWNKKGYDPVQAAKFCYEKLAKAFSSAGLDGSSRL